MADTAQIEHLLRRTEFVARPDRVAELTPLSLEDAVDDILDVPISPPGVALTAPTDWQQGVELTHFWLDRMAHDSPRPIQEKMSFFWHNHFCSEFTKVASGVLAKEQIDLFRTDGMGDLRSLAIEMSTQVAMLRYLDNNQNKASSPNQNFARELMELFLLGVGNYTEADVEASTAAWTGHTDQWDTDQYVWRSDWHDASTKQYLGRTINQGGDPKLHGAETIEVVLGEGVVPAAAPIAGNRGRPTRQVAAEFVSTKLWVEFAGTPIPPAVLASLRDTAIANDFAIKPWLRTLLLRDEFYAADARSGRVRTPVEYVVAALAATGLRSESGTPFWLMEGMGQRPLFPPNVSGWKHNGYWVNASAMAKRIETAQQMAWQSMRGYWNGDGLVHLAGGTISKDEINGSFRDRPADLVDRFLELMHLSYSSASRDALVAYSTASERWERPDLLALILVAPDFHLA